MLAPQGSLAEGSPDAGRILVISGQAGLIDAVSLSHHQPLATLS
jgi:hypothetical protein